MDASTLLALVPGGWLPYVSGIWIACGLLMVVVSPPTDQAPQWWRVVYGIINKIALNFGNARNGVPAAPASSPAAVPPGARSFALLMTALALGVLLSACTPAQQASASKTLASPGGQLFCAFQMQGGGTMVAGIVGTAATVAATAAAPGAAVASGPIIALATNAAKADVDQTCADAAKNVVGVVPGTPGTPVSPPANVAAAPQVATALPPTLPTAVVVGASATGG